MPLPHPLPEGGSGLQAGGPATQTNRRTAGCVRSAGPAIEDGGCPLAATPEAVCSSNSSRRWGIVPRAARFSTFRRPGLSSAHLLEKVRSGNKKSSRNTAGDFYLTVSRHWLHLTPRLTADNHAKRDQVLLSLSQDFPRMAGGGGLWPRTRY